MRTRSKGTSFSFIQLTPNSEVALYRQLASGVQSAIESGALTPGEQIPATRTLMDDLSISRNTALAAINQLIQLGLVVARPGSGMYVADRQPPVAPLEKEEPLAESPILDLTSTQAGSAAPLPTEPRFTQSPAPGTGLGPMIRTGSPAMVPQSFATQLDTSRPEPIHRAAILPQIPLNLVSAFPAVRPFRPGLGDHREFPLSLWERLRARVIKEINVDVLGPEDPAGHAPLREAVARYLGEVRGVHCVADQVFLTTGLAETIQVITTALMPPDGVVAMEEPGHLHAKAAFLATGARLMPLLVDEEGVLPPHARRKNPPYLLYVTPGHQFPLGATLSLPRRLGLLEFVRQTGALILEDDYDREFLDESYQPPTIHSMDTGTATLYTISFSKLLFSALRLSAVVVPVAFTELFLRAMAVVSGPKPALDQATLALFLKEGHFVSHVRYLRTIYQNRTSIVRECFAADLKGILELDSAHGGLHAVGWLGRGWDEREVASIALAAGIDLMPLGSFGKTALQRPGVVIGLAAWQEDEIRRATARLAMALNSIRDRGLAMAAPTGA